MVHHKKVLVCGLVCGSTKKIGKSLNFEKSLNIANFSIFFQNFQTGIAQRSLRDKKNGSSQKGLSF